MGEQTNAAIRGFPITDDSKIPLRRHQLSQSMSIKVEYLINQETMCDLNVLLCFGTVHTVYIPKTILIIQHR